MSTKPLMHVVDTNTLVYVFFICLLAIEIMFVFIYSQYLLDRELWLLK